MVEAAVRAVGVDAGTGQAVVLLEERAGAGRILPVTVGGPEAVAAARALAGTTAARPGTHRLIGDLLEMAGRRLERVRVHELRGAVFHAELRLDDGTRVDARTSDAVVLALQAGAPIEIDETVLALAAVAPDVVRVEEPGRAAGEVQELRRFLDTAVPDDFRPDRP